VAMAMGMETGSAWAPVSSSVLITDTDQISAALTRLGLASMITTISAGMAPGADTAPVADMSAVVRMAGTAKRYLLNRDRYRKVRTRLIPSPMSTRVTHAIAY